MRHTQNSQKAFIQIILIEGHQKYVHVGQNHLLKPNFPRILIG